MGRRFAPGVSMQPSSIPVFPLHSVLLPGGVLPLRIFEARYLDMISRCLREDSGFAISQIREGSETRGGAVVWPVGARVRIIGWDSLSDGLLGVTVEAVERVRLSGFIEDRSHLLWAHAESLPDDPDRMLPPEFDTLARLLERILKQIGPPFDQLSPRLDDAGWVAGRLTELLPIEPEAKQQLLELSDPLSRLHLLRDAMKALPSDA